MTPSRLAGTDTLTVTLGVLTRREGPLGVAFSESVLFFSKSVIEWYFVLSAGSDAGIIISRIASERTIEG